MRNGKRQLGIWLTGGICLALSLGLALAQQEALEQLSAALDDGYYAWAAEVIGPEAVANHPNIADTHFLYSKALYLTGELAAARAELERAFGLGAPRDTPVYAHLNGLLYAAEGQFEEAQRELRQAAQASQSYDISMDWARVAWQAGAYDSALEAYLSAANTPQGQQEIWPHLNRGRIYTFLTNYDQAIKAFDQAISVFEANDIAEGQPPPPAYTEAYYRLGEVYEALGDEANAISNYEASRSIDPNYVPALAALERLQEEP